MGTRRDAAIDRPDVSVVVPTYNRAAGVKQTLDSLLSQRSAARRYEVIVVDNNSTSATRSAIERASANRASRVRYVLERTQGVASARNAGIAVARAPIVAFVDDDVRVDENWIETICRTFDEHPEVDCIGGRVLPAWQGPPPTWLTRDHWAPAALLDFGDEGQYLDSSNQRCLLTANLACRRKVFETIGRFGTDVQRVRDGIGSMEDHEWLMRLWRSGARALYVPDLRAVTDVPLARMTRAYHRRWHTGHGHYFALVREPEFECSNTGRLFDVPAHVYRAASREAVGWVSRILRGDTTGAFLFETRLRFFAGYFRTRAAAYLSRRRPGYRTSKVATSGL